jgi:polysaccharide deacetylase family protein (PEP-CTERM system associated)
VRVGDRPVEPLPPGAPAFALTVDVEDWFHTNHVSAPRLDPATLPRRVETSVACVLETVAARGARGTFFVLGCVARDHPSLVRRIVAAGHEVGCHGMTHTLAYEQEPAAFRAAVGDARKLLSDQSGQPVWGFRAPSWSVTERSLWVFEALVACGFRYDSSVFPAANYLYGVAGAPRAPYRVRTADGGEIVEVPPPVIGAGRRRFGVGGGFYLRVLPVWLQRRALRDYARRGVPFLLYVHPRELDPGARAFRLPLSLRERLIAELGMRSVPRKMARLLAGRRWQPLADVLRERGALA